MELAEGSVERQLDRGDALVKQGHSDRHLYLIQQGSLAVAIDGNVVDTLMTGAIVGELAALIDAPRSATVTAMGPCRVLMISDVVLKRMLDTSPALGLALACVLSRRLRRLL